MAKIEWKNKIRCHLCDRKLIKRDILDSHHAFTIYKPDGNHSDHRHPSLVFFNKLEKGDTVEKLCLVCLENRDPIRHYKYNYSNKW